MNDASAKRSHGKAYTTKRPPAQTFAHWCAGSAAALIAPLNLDAEIVGWLTCVLRAGEMSGIENISTLERVLVHRRSDFRFPTDAAWDRVMLTARVLFRTWEQTKGGAK